MFGALKGGRFRSLASLILVVNVVGELQQKRTLAASRGFLAAARLSCLHHDRLDLFVCVILSNMFYSFQFTPHSNNEMKHKYAVEAAVQATLFTLHALTLQYIHRTLYYRLQS